MRRFIAILIAGVLCLVYCTPSFSAEEKNSFWTKKVIISNSSDIPNGYSSIIASHDLCVDEKGHAIAIWMRYIWNKSDWKDIWSNVVVNEYKNQTGWQRPIELYKDYNRYNWTMGARIALDGYGNGIIVWTKHNETNSELLSMSFNQTIGWGELRSRTINNEISPEDFDELQSMKLEFIDIEMLSNGMAIAAWVSYNDDHFSIRGSIFNSLNGWGPEFEISDDHQSDTYGLALAGNGKDTVIIGWTQYDVYTDFKTRRYSIADGWGNVIGISTPHPTNNSLPIPQISINMNTLGETIATWPTTSGIWANKYEEFSGWDGDELIFKGEGRRCEIGIDDFGNAIAVVECKRDCKIIRYIKDAGWQNPTTQYWSEVDIDVNGRGNAAIITTLSSLIGNRLMARYFDSNLGWSNGEEIEYGGELARFLPIVGLDGDGNAIAIWINENIYEPYSYQNLEIFSSVFIYNEDYWPANETYQLWIFVFFLIFCPVIIILIVIRNHRKKT